MGAPLSGSGSHTPPQSLLLRSAFAASKSRRAVAFALPHFGNAMPFTNRAAFPRLAAVHLAMFDGVDQLQVFRSTAGPNMTPVMNVVTRGAFERFVNEAMHLAQLGRNSDVAVPGAICRSRPEPAITNHYEPCIQAQQSLVREHEGSIQLPGFDASRSAQTGSVHESAVATPDAQPLDPQS